MSPRRRWVVERFAFIAAGLALGGLLGTAFVLGSPGAAKAVRPTDAQCSAARGGYDLAAYTLYDVRGDPLASSSADDALAAIRTTIADCVWPPPTSSQCLDAIGDHGVAYYELGLIEATYPETHAENPEAQKRVREKLAAARNVLFACLRRADTIKAPSK